MSRLIERPLRWTLDLPDSAAGMAFAPDGRRLAVATLAGDVLLLDTSTGELASSGADHRGGALAVAWHPSGTSLATAGQDGRVCLVDPVSSQKTVYRSFGRGWVEHLAWSEDGTELAIAAGKAVHVVSTHGDPIAEFDAQSTVAALAWLPGERRLAVAGRGGIWIHPTGERKAPIDLPWSGALLSIAPSPNGKVIATGSHECSLQLWDWPSGEVSEVTGFSAKVRNLAWNSTGNLLAATGGDCITLWRFSGVGLVSKRPTVLMEHKARITGLAFLGDEALASIDGAGRFITWSKRKHSWRRDSESVCKTRLTGLVVTPSVAVVTTDSAGLLVFELDNSHREETAA
jgi:WD40 repeat protein